MGLFSIWASRSPTHSLNWANVRKLRSLLLPEGCSAVPEPCSGEHIGQVALCHGAGYRQLPASSLGLVTGLGRFRNFWLSSVTVRRGGTEIGKVVARAVPLGSGWCSDADLESHHVFLVE